MDSEELVHYFRQTDQTSAAIGQRQAKVFQTFAAIAGHGEIEVKGKTSGAGGAKKPIKTSTKAVKKSGAKKIVAEAEDDDDVVTHKGKLGLTVRVEINLPADGTKETYDNIFKSIRANLIDD